MRAVLITGAGRGFGRELFRVFSECGWTVFPLVRNTDTAAELVATNKSKCFPIIGDVASEKTADEIAGVLDAHADSLDLLINNAGNVKKHRGLRNTPACDLEDLFRVHCIGAFRCTKAALPFLKKAERPVVINITSRWGSIARTVSGKGGRIYSYQIAKSAQNMLTACLDQELKGDGIRVFAVHPGRLKTEVAAADANVEPREAALRLFDWAGSVDREVVCGCHDLMSGELIEW